RDEGELLVIALREQRNGLQHRDAGISHSAGGYVVRRWVARPAIGMSFSDRNWCGFHRNDGVQEHDVAPTGDGDVGRAGSCVMNAQQISYPAEDAEDVF